MHFKDKSSTILYIFFWKIRYLFISSFCLREEVSDFNETFFLFSQMSCFVFFCYFLSFFLFLLAIVGKCLFNLIFKIIFTFFSMLYSDHNEIYFCFLNFMTVFQNFSVCFQLMRAALNSSWQAWEWLLKLLWHKNKSYWHLNCKSNSWIVLLKIMWSKAVNAWYHFIFLTNHALLEISVENLSIEEKLFISEYVYLNC